MSLTPGSRLGPYEIVSSLGAGGMGEVYRAHDPRLGRDVALKILPAALSADPDSLARFTREARAVAALNHPNIVTLHSTEESDGVRFMTMELIEGRTLERLIPSTGVSRAQFFDVSMGIAEALSAAHQKNITHRDLKPLNVMLTNSGHVKVLDFGLAQSRSQEANAGVEATRELLTQAGMVVGTAPYMSPEQVEARPLDGRSDIFSLGIVMYQMLTGARPFRGESSQGLMASILRDQPKAIRDFRSDVSEGVIRLIDRCLKKSPVDRIQSAQEVLFELKALRRASESGETATRARDESVEPTALLTASATAPRSSRRLLVAGAAIVIAASVGWWALHDRTTESAAGRPSSSDRKQDTSIAVLPFADLSADQGGAYLGAGVAETISTALSKLPGLSITVRSQASSPHDQAAGLREIGKQLGVANILTGSIQRAGGQLRIAARLVRADTEGILWSNVFDRPAADIFAVQDEVARNVAQALELTLNTASTTAAPTGGTKNTEAYDAYLLGRYHWNRRTTDGMIQATAAFKKAIDLDPNYAQAWSGLADAYSLSIPTEYNVPSLDPAEALRRAEEAARKATALAPGLGEAQVSLGMALSNSGRSGMESFERAVALSPSYASAHQFYAYELGPVGRWDEATREMELAHRLDPLSHVITLSLAATYDGADRFAEASPLYAQGLAQSPEAWYAWVMRFAHDLALSKMDDAAVSLRTGLNGIAFTIVTKDERARMIRLADEWAIPATREKATENIIRTGEPLQALALARWQRGDKATIETLEAIVRDDRRKGVSSALVVYGILGPKLRLDPRVQAVARQLGFPPLQTSAR
ncbi:MAG: protein kinase [Vicinamibacteria bacterium]